MDESAVERLLEKFDNSGLKEMKVNGNGVDIYFSKLANKNDGVSQSQNTDKDTSKSETTKSENYKLRAPIVGIAYLAPSDKKPKYKAIGSHVKNGEPICAIEAMKLINEVKSPVSGTVKKALISNGEMVEYNQPLFEIEED